jgi:hypothetical protein
MFVRNSNREEIRWRVSEAPSRRGRAKSPTQARVREHNLTGVLACQSATNFVYTDGISAAASKGIGSVWSFQEHATGRVCQIRSNEGDPAIKCTAIIAPKHGHLSRTWFCAVPEIWWLPVFSDVLSKFGTFDSP